MAFLTFCNGFDDSQRIDKLLFSNGSPTSLEDTDLTISPPTVASLDWNAIQKNTWHFKKGEQLLLFLNWKENLTLKKLSSKPFFVVWWRVFWEMSVIIN